MFFFVSQNIAHAIDFQDIKDQAATLPYKNMYSIHIGPREILVVPYDKGFIKFLKKHYTPFLHFPRSKSDIILKYSMQFAKEGWTLMSAHASTLMVKKILDFYKVDHIPFNKIASFPYLYFAFSKSGGISIYGNNLITSGVKLGMDFALQKYAPWANKVWLPTELFVRSARGAIPLITMPLQLTLQKFRYNKLMREIRDPKRGNFVLLMPDKITEKTSQQLLNILKPHYVKREALKK